MRSTKMELRAGGAATAVLIAVLAVGLTVAGQEADAEKAIGGLAFMDEVQITVVNIDVFVRDREGNVVTGLSEEDFRLTQDGRERKLSHFAAYTQEVISDIMQQRDEAMPAVSPPGSGEGVEGVPDGKNSAATAMRVQPVHLALYVDNENLRPIDRNRVLTQVRSFLREIMAPHVQVMVVSAARSTRIVQDFTNDPKEIVDALRSLRKLSGARSSRDTQRGRLIHNLQAMEDQAASGNRKNMAVQAIDVEGRIRNYGEEITMELDYSMAALREITISLAGLPGRKVFVHISSGLPMVPARDLIAWYGEVFQGRSILPMLARFDRSRMYEALASAANAQGVTFYMIDASGVSGTAGSSAEYTRPVDPLAANLYVINHQQPLQIMAERTGGRAILDTNDITGGLKELRDDLFTYYSLGYTISSSGADTVHRVDVELPNHPAYRLVYRRTYVEKSLETTVQEAVLSGLMVTPDHNPMGLEISAGATRPTGDDRWILPIEVRFPITSVALLPEGDEYVGRLALFITNRNLAGRQADVQRREFEIRMPLSDYETRRHESYVADLGLLMEAGTHKLVVGLLDPVTRQSSYAALTRAVPGD
ncbi:MAG: VWA domain-containing protein [Thermoanaerobaculales bacterium]